MVEDTSALGLPPLAMLDVLSMALLVVIHTVSVLARTSALLLAGLPPLLWSATFCAVDATCTAVVVAVDFLAVVEMCVVVIALMVDASSVVVDFTAVLEKRVVVVALMVDASAVTVDFMAVVEMCVVVVALMVGAVVLPVTAVQTNVTVS